MNTKKETHQQTGQHDNSRPETDNQANPEVSADQTASDSMSCDGQENDSHNDEVSGDAGLWKDKYMRLSAEFDNYRKRTLKEKMDLISTGGENIVKVLLPVLDDMDRALDAMRRTDDIDSVRTGVELISAKMRDTLAASGLSEIESVGLPLDTDLHDAVARTPAGEKSRGKIVDVAQKGYKYKDKVVRHAKVVVGE